jgi:hypothetical protein
MDKQLILFIAAGLIATLAAVFINIYLAGIVLILVITLAMSLFIMKDSRFLPDVSVKMREDAKGIVLTNKGTAEARSIHVALVPLNIEFDVPSIAVDAQHVHTLDTMFSEAKAVTTWESEQGEKFSRSTMLSALGNEEEDLLKPAFPLFKWK